MPSLGEQCFFTLCGQYPGTGFLSTSKSCQCLPHIMGIHLPSSSSTTNHQGHHHHFPLGRLQPPLSLSHPPVPYASFKSILKSTSQSEFLKTHAGSCQWPPSLSLPVAVTRPLSTVNSKLTLSKAPTPKMCRFPHLFTVPTAHPVPSLLATCHGPNLTHPNALSVPAPSLVLVSPGSAISGCFHCSACSCLHP